MKFLAKLLYEDKYNNGLTGVTKSEISIILPKIQKKWNEICPKRYLFSYKDGDIQDKTRLAQIHCDLLCTCCGIIYKHTI